MANPRKSGFYPVLVVSESKTIQPAKAARNLLGIVAFLGRYPGSVSLSLGLLLIVLGLDLVLPQVLGDALTQLRMHVDWGASFDPWVYAQLFGSIVLMRAGTAYVLGPIRNRLIQRSLTDIRSEVYDAIQRLPFAYHDRTNSGELISRSTTDVWRLQDFLFACLFLSVDIVVALVATMALVFAVHPVLGWTALATMLPTVGLIIWFAGKLQPQWRKVHDLHSSMTSVIQENIAGVRVVKAFAQEPAQVSKFKGRKDEYLDVLMKAVNYWAARVPFAQFIYGLSLPLVLWLGGRMVIQGELVIGDLAKVVFYLMAIGHRVGMVGQFTNILQNASASAERVLEILHEPRTILDGKQPLLPGPGEVRFEGVSFHYASNKPSVEDISFTASPGQTVAIVGPTGSGKSTLVHLIPRFYEATQGRVLLDGVDVRELRLADLRRSVGVIFQDSFLFSATIAENIAYGRPEATLPEIEAAARTAQAHEFIVQLESGYQTVVGERGVTLSGGQKQRIAIARAFLINPRILILDDATASVDPETERMIRESMVRLCEGRTTFIIAHRVATVQRAHQILVLREGRIVESGTHEGLLQNGVFYREIFQQQLHS